MQNFHVCHICGGKMFPCIEAHTYTYNGKNITINDVHFYKCEMCGEGILTSQEVKRIENIVRNAE